ncbi:hypothetical protein RB653_008243 [Dictyostelium firmibasis]|uniref:SET domain-containing protein n=1 Tax=Dictyostelium firmibasis TaxID=79012 RepID=A0AAN7YTV1_9MYCE
MIEWGINNGIEWNEKLKVYDFKDTGRGIITNDEIKENEVLISIPEKFLIHSKSKFSLDKLNPPNISNKINTTNKKGLTTTIENNNPSPLSIFYKPFHDSVNQFNPKQRISFHLIIEKLLKKNSIWFNYLNDLPNEYNITSTYDDKEIEYIGYPIYVEKVFKLKNEMISSFNSFKEILMKNYENDLNRIIIKLNDNDNENENDEDNDKIGNIKLNEIINFNLYEWCWGTIQSRTYYYNRNMKQQQQQKLESDKDDCTLVPLADLFNHSSFVDTEAIFNEKKQCYQVITKTRFEKDTQVFISYGKHSNFTLMNYYGFIIENNTNDSIPLIQGDAIPNQLLLEKENDIKSYEKKLLILEQYGLSIYGDNSKFLILIDKELPFSWNYLSVLKVLFMTKDELNNQLELNLFHYDLPISKSNHEKVLNFLKNLSISQLTHFKNYLNSYNNNNNNNNINNNNNFGGFNDINNNDNNGIGKRFEISYILEFNIKMWEGCIEWVDLQCLSLKEEKEDILIGANQKKNKKKKKK